MKKQKTITKPSAFIYRSRFHNVSSWKNLTHDLIEDLIFSGIDKNSEKILDINMPTAAVPICVSEKRTVSGRLSNGNYMPFIYSESIYESICRDICDIYRINPLDLRIILEDDIDEFKERYEVEVDAADTEKTISKEIIEAERKPEEVSKQPEEKEKKAKDKNISFEIRKVADKIIENTIKDIQPLIEEVDEDDPEDTIIEFRCEWDDVIDYFGNFKKDLTTASEAKKMQRMGLIPPSDMNYNLVFENKNEKVSKIASAYEGRIIANAAMIWEKEKIVYLTKKQDECSSVFQEHGYKTFTNNVKGLSEALYGVL